MKTGLQAARIPEKKPRKVVSAVAGMMLRLGGKA